MEEEKVLVASLFLVVRPGAPSSVLAPTPLAGIALPGGSAGAAAARAGHRDCEAAALGAAWLAPGRY